MGLIQDMYRVQAYAETLCRHAETKTGKSFKVYYNDIEGPYTTEDKRSVKIYLPKPRYPVNAEQLKLQRYFVVHEVLHHTEGADIAKAWKEGGLKYFDPKDPMWGMAMSVEDMRIEKEGGAKFKGDAVAISEGLELVIHDMVEMVKKPKVQELLQNDPYGWGVMAEIAANLSARTTYCAGAGTHLNALVEALPQKSKEGLKKLLDAGYDEVLRNIETESEGLQAAKFAFETLFEENADEHMEQQSQQQGEGDSEEGSGESGQEGNGQEGKGEKGDGSKAGTGQGDDTGDNSGDGEDNGKADKENEAKTGRGNKDGKGGQFTDAKGNMDYLELLTSKHGDSAGSSAGGSGLTINYDKWAEKDRGWNGFEPTPLRDIRWRDYKTGEGTLRGESDGRESMRTEYRNRGGHDERGSKAFANKVARLLKTKSQARYVGAQKKGRLDRRNVYRVGVKQVGNGEWNSKVFRKKHQDDVLDTAVQILVDFSGSMYGNKMVHAIDSALLLNDTLSRALHMPVEVLGFSERSRTTEMGIFKKFDDTYRQEVLKDNMLKFTAYMSQNSDGEAISWAAHRLAKRKEKRKVLIVLSDGQPASSRYGDAASYTKDIIEEIEKSPVMEIYGIGIRSDSVRHFYKEHDVIYETDELEKAVLNVIKKKLL